MVTRFLIFIIQGFQTIIFFIVRLTGVSCQTWEPAWNFESTGVACYDSVYHNWVKVLSIPLLLLACSR